MNKMSFAALAVLMTLTLTACELITATTSNTTPGATTPSVHGSVVLTVTSGSLPAGSQVRVAITENSPKALAAVPVTVPTGTYHKDLPVSAAGTVNYTVTGVPDGSYTIAVTLMDSSSVALGLTSYLNIEVAGGACAVPTVSLSYPPVSIE